MPRKLLLLMLCFIPLVGTCPGFKPALAAGTTVLATAATTVAAANATATNPAASPAPGNGVSPKRILKLFVNGAKANPEIQALLLNQTYYVNLPFLTKYLHAVTQWDPDNGDLAIRFGVMNVAMSENKTEYAVNGAIRMLAAPPFEEDGQLWLPAEYICRLGMTLKKSASDELHFAWDANYLLGVENVMYQSRPAFLLVGTDDFQISSFILTGPDRLVVDLKGIKAHLSFDPNLPDNPFVKQVRFHQQSEDSLRVVFDLNRLTGYQIIRQPGKEHQALIVFNYFVEDVQFSQKDQERKVFIRTGFPARYTVTRMKQPDRMVIDLDGATLAGSSLPLPGDGIWVKKVRMSQFDAKTVRVVLDLADQGLCFVKTARDNPNLIEIRAVQTVTQINLTQSDPETWELAVEADGELAEKIQKLSGGASAPDKLRIDLAFARPAPGLRGPTIRNPLLQGIALATPDESTVRLDLNLTKFVDYRVVFSPDRRRMAIRLRRSRLVDKVMVLDPGHGGVDPGGIGRQGTREKDVNLEVALRLKALLEDAGAGVVLTRRDDSYIGLYERPFDANNLFADMFISIHSNIHSNLSVRGTEVYYYAAHSADKILAQYVADRMHECTGLVKLGVKTNDFVVIRETQMPGILVELGYLSNYQEETLLNSPEFQDTAAQGIFQGVRDYYDK